jgi:hypothetical protein
MVVVAVGSPAIRLARLTLVSLDGSLELPNL